MPESETKNTRELQALSRKLLAEGEVEVVIGWRAGSFGHATRPAFVTSPDEVDSLVWSEFCVNNLAVYLTTPEVKRMGKPAIVAKGCDARAIVVLLQEAQLERENVVIIGVGCEQVRDFGPDGSAGEVLAKCLSCQVRTPPVYDHLIGGEIPPRPAPPDLSKVERLEAMDVGERWQFWREALAPCTKCYACRAACPLCYCNRCFVDKTRPAWTSTAVNGKENFFYHLFRAFHLVGRCIECGECERVCPQRIPLGLLNKKMVKEVDSAYTHVSGMDPAVCAPLCAYSLGDNEDFIL